MNNLLSVAGSGKDFNSLQKTCVGKYPLKILEPSDCTSHLIFPWNWRSTGEKTGTTKASRGLCSYHKNVIYILFHLPDSSKAGCPFKTDMKLKKNYLAKCVIDL